MTQLPPPTQPGPIQHLQPHRGVMILVFGILGLVICVIFGIVAWVMGGGDLRAMAEGRMDPTGEGLTKAGRICGMISVALTIVGIGIWVLIMILAVGAGVAGAASGAAGGAGP
ncbi:MAG: DUF4190 domain-containing protein [Phycisphaerales bacterium]